MTNTTRSLICLPASGPRAGVATPAAATVHGRCSSPTEVISSNRAPANPNRRPRWTARRSPATRPKVAAKLWQIGLPHRRTRTSLDPSPIVSGPISSVAASSNRWTTFESPTPPPTNHCCKQSPSISQKTTTTSSRLYGSSCEARRIAAAARHCRKTWETKNITPATILAV